MMRKQLSYWLIVVLLVASCEKEFELADYKEIPVIYCFLNLRDSVHYVRVNRMYHADDPYPCMQIHDSIYFGKDELVVSIERYVNDKLTGDTVYFYPTTDIPKEDGSFTNDEHIIYKTTEPIYPNSDYILRVKNRITGAEAWSRTSILGRRSMEDAFLDNRKIQRPYYIPEYINYHSSLNPDNYDIKTIRFLFKEIVNDKELYRFVDWIPEWHPLDCGDQSGDTLSTQFYDCYYRYLAERIPLDPEVKRIAVGVDYMITIANKELITFIEVAQKPSHLLFVPEYSNITNGYGIFSSTYGYTYFAKKLKDETIDTISWGRYLKNHRFADSKGNWH